MELKYNSNLWLCQIKKGWDSIERSESGPGGIRITPPIKKVGIV